MTARIGDVCVQGMDSYQFAVQVEAEAAEINEARVSPGGCNEVDAFRQRYTELKRIQAAFESAYGGSHYADHGAAVAIKDMGYTLKKMYSSCKQLA